MEIQPSRGPEDMSSSPRQPTFIKNMKGSTNPEGSVYKIDYGNRPPVVEIITGFKYYRKCCRTKPVLSNFNMMVPVGHLYGLIGPKLCGKTTVVKVVVRRHKLTFGTLKLFGTTARIDEPCKMGYMTQNLGFDESFTMVELLRYYGQLLKLNSFYINERIEVLASLLEIPRESVRIEKMNANNKKKISFALSVLHEPELLILDEPTSGADPVVRHLIWQHLLLVTANMNMSVLLTSHDLEEGIDCDSVGLMRNGKTLIQGPPSQILQVLASQQLTGAFYILGAQAGEAELGKSKTAKSLVIATETATQPLLQQTPSKGFNLDTRQYRFIGPAQGFSDETRREQQSSIKKCCAVCIPHNGPSCHRICSLLCRCYSRIIHMVWFWLLLLLLPIFYILLFAMAIGGMPYELNLGIVNEQTKHCDLSRFQSKFSCSMLSGLDNTTIRKIPYDTMPAGLDALDDGSLDGLLIFTYNERMISSFVSADIRQVRCRPFVALLLQKNTFLIQQILKEEVEESFTKVSVYETYDGLDTVKVVPYNRSNVSLVTSRHVIWGAIVALVFAVGALLGGWTMAKKYNLQIVDRLLLTGIALPEIYIVHLLVWLTIIVIQIFIMMLVAFAITGFSMESEDIVAMFKSFAITMPLAFSGIALGILIFSICQYVPATIRVTVYILVPVFLLSGIFWPFDSLSYYLKPIGWILPTTQAVLAMDGIMIQFLPLTSTEVFPGIVIPIAWGIIFYISAAGMLALQS